MTFKELFKNYIYPIAVFSGGMIGVGFLSLPYIALNAGIWLMTAYFLVITTLTIIINLIFCKISLKTPDQKRFPGFVEYYLGRGAKFLAMISTVLGAFGVLLAFLLVGSQFLVSVFQPILSGTVLIYVLVYFFIVSIVIYFDIKIVSKTAFWVISLIFLSLILIFVEGFAQIKISNIFIGDWTHEFFLPYGPLLFALWGIGLIPEVEEMLVGQKKKLNAIAVISIVITSIFYFLFVILILGITGSKTDPTALAGLKGFLPDYVVSASLLAGALATFTAFVSQGIILKKTLMFDLKIKHWHAFVMTCCPPLIFFLLGFKDFIPLLSFIGGVLFGINGILILLMYKKIGGKKIVVYPLSLVFLLGIIYEVIYFIK